MGCTGDCCASFTLTQRVQLEIMNGTDYDAQTIRYMLIPQGEGAFTCKHWDPDTKLCGIYERRPEMCQSFPERGNPCGIEGCTLKS